MIMCTVKGCTTNNFPLKIKATSVQKEEAEFNENFMKHMMTKLDWPAIVVAAKDVRYNLLIIDIIHKNIDTVC